MSNLLKIFSGAVILLTLGAILYFYQDTEVVKQQDQAYTLPVIDAQRAMRNVSQVLPDFDQRLLLVEDEDNKVDLYDITEARMMFITTELELQSKIKEYNQYLDDPDARKQIIDELKDVRAQYKQALLVKLKQGDL